MRRSSASARSSRRSRSHRRWSSSSCRSPTTCSRPCAAWWAVASEVKLPRLGQGMEAGTITKWLKSEGERVEKGEPLYEIDTDKATQEVEAEASGVLLKIAVESGEVPGGQRMALIGGRAAPVGGPRPRRARCGSGRRSP